MATIVKRRKIPSSNSTECLVTSKFFDYIYVPAKMPNFFVMARHSRSPFRWAKIASFLPGRTDNEIKNIWNTYLGKRFAPKNGSLAFQKTFSYSATIAASVTGEARCSIDGDAPNPSRKEAETSIDMLSDLGTPDMQPLQRDSSQEQFHCMISSSTLSTPLHAVAATAEDLNAQWGKQATAIDEIDIDSAIDPDFWNDTINSFTAPATISNTSQEGKVPIDFDESERWMVELVKELGLFKEVHGMEEVVIEQGRERREAETGFFVKRVVGFEIIN